MTDEAVLSWQKVANVASAVLFVIGGYIGTESIKQVQNLQTTAGSQAQQIARLEERRDAQERVNGELSERLRRMEDKLDRVLEERRREGAGNGLTGRMFDK